MGVRDNVNLDGKISIRVVMKWQDFYCMKKCSRSLAFFCFTGKKEGLLQRTIKNQEEKA